MKSLVLGLGLLSWGCGVRLDEPAPPPASGKAPPLAPNCRWFERAGITRVAGRVSGLALDDGSTLFVAGSVEQAGGQIDNAGFVAAPGATADDCYADATLLDHSLLDASALPAGSSLAALAPVEALATRWLYYDRYQGLTRVGTGIAKWDDASQRFVPGEQLLFSGDRPNYGGAAVFFDGEIFVYGCVNGFPDADCSVARVPADRPDDESAYRFYSGGGHFAASIEDAWSMLRAGDPVAVGFDAARGRWVMAYASPLASSLSLRTGLSPTGPWSKAFEVARCDTAKDAFCAGVSLLPSPAAGAPVALGYALATFTPGAVDATPSAYWSRLTHVAIPLDAP